MDGDETIERGTRTLEAVLSDEPPTIGDAIRLASEVADEVAALHAAGRAHGGIAPATVVIDPAGVARLAGPPAPKTGPAAPPALRTEDLHGVGRVLAALLGWPDQQDLPEPVADLVERAAASDAPAAALATALRRLDREPLAVAALLPRGTPPVPARRQEGLGAVVRMIPRADRRTTGTAAVVVAGAAAIGAVLLLVGSPSSTGRAPTAAAEARSARAVAAPPVVPAEVADAAPQSIQAILRPTAVAVQPIPARTSQPVERRAVPAVEIAAPAPTPTAVATPSAAPTATVVPTAAPTASPDPTAGPTAPPSEEPTTPPNDPEPSDRPTASDPPSAPSAAPTTEPAPASEPTSTAG